MKILTKSKLPRWIMSQLPFGQEEELISSVVVPAVLFSIMAIAMIWHKFYVASWIVLEVVLTIIVLALIFAIVWWIIVQVDVLVSLRKRYSLHYEITQDSMEKSKTEEMLKSLCVTLDSLYKKPVGQEF